MTSRVVTVVTNNVRQLGALPLGKNPHTLYGSAKPQPKPESTKTTSLAKVLSEIDTLEKFIAFETRLRTQAVTQQKAWEVLSTLYENYLPRFTRVLGTGHMPSDLNQTERQEYITNRTGPLFMKDFVDMKERLGQQLAIEQGASPINPDSHMPATPEF